LKVALRCEAKEQVEHLLFQVSFLSTDWTTRLATLQAGEPGEPIGVTPPGGIVEFSCPALSLQPGAYYVTAVVRDAATMEPIHWFDGNCMLHLTGGPTLAGQVYVPHTWQYEASVEMTTSRG
jgi:hypothetical protein